jgi:hypothetical protein
VVRHQKTNDFVFKFLSRDPNPDPDTHIMGGYSIYITIDRLTSKVVDVTQGGGS